MSGACGPLPLTAGLQRSLKIRCNKNKAPIGALFFIAELPGLRRLNDFAALRVQSLENRGIAKAEEIKRGLAGVCLGPERGP